jgi:hypothetical protein
VTSAAVLKLLVIAPGAARHRLVVNTRAVARDHSHRRDGRFVII